VDDHKRSSHYGCFMSNVTEIIKVAADVASNDPKVAAALIAAGLLVWVGKGLWDHRKKRRAK